MARQPATRGIRHALGGFALSRTSARCAREETRENRAMPGLFPLNTGRRHTRFWAEKQSLGSSLNRRGHAPPHTIARLSKPLAAWPYRRRTLAIRCSEWLEMLPLTIFFFVGFNFIVLTTNLLVAQYLVAVSNFMLATLAALVVGKAVLVAHKMALLRRYDRAPLIQPILYKTAFYWVVVFFVRLLERFVHFAFDGNPPGDFISYLITTFSWHRFSAISLWILVLFLIYVTATEFSRLFGPGELRRLFFTSRPRVAAQSAAADP